MAELAQQDHKLNVFISYSRADLAFADQLDAALRLAGFETTIDRHGILPGEDWQKRLGGLIRDADTVIFVLSPSSARSKVCAWEAAEAVRLGKRILPVLCRPLKSATPPPQLAELNYIFFYAELKSPGSGWGTGLVMLASALNTDIEWLREHTRYLQRATEWEAGEKRANRLLSGPDIATAKAWAARRPENAPEPTALQLSFIEESEGEYVRRQSAEVQRLREIEEAQAEREKALADRESALKSEAAARQSQAEAQEREAEQARRVARRTLAGLAAAIVLALLASGFAIFAYQQRGAALQATETAKVERDNARKATNDAINAKEETKRQLDRVNQALAQSINNDLVFGGFSWAPRTRSALWKLAFADEAVKTYYVSSLTNNLGETGRAAPGSAEIFRALGLLRPSPAETQRFFAAAIGVISTSEGGENSYSLVAEIGALVPKLTTKQVGQTLDPVLNAIGKTTYSPTLDVLAETIQALAPNLTNAKAGQVLDLVLMKIGQTNDDTFGLQAFAKMIRALPVELTDAQAAQALDPVLNAIGQATDVNDARRLVQTFQALAPKLTDAQAAQALDKVPNKIGQTTDPVALRALAEAIPALPVKLTDAKAAQVLELILMKIGQTTDPYTLRALARAIQALPVKLTDAQAAQAIDVFSNEIGKQIPALLDLRDLAEAFQALAPKLTDAQAAQALDKVLKFVQTTDIFAVGVLAKAIPALAPKRADAKVAQVLELILMKIGQTKDDTEALQELAQAIAALPVKLTDAQAAQALDPVLNAIGQTELLAADPKPLQAFQALAPQLTDAQAAQALDKVLNKIGQTTDTFALQELAQAIAALPVKLTDAQAAQALDPLLKQIGKITHPFALQEIAEAIAALPVKLTDAQAAQALDPLLNAIGRATDSEALQALAQAIAAVAPKLSPGQAQNASQQARASLAWSARESEAADWARALVALLNRAEDPDKTQKLAAAVAYPAAAGAATDVLLDAIRAGHPDAPMKEAGTEPALVWLTKTFPNALSPPVCPPPLQDQTDLKCPPLASVRP